MKRLALVTALLALIGGIATTAAAPAKSAKAKPAAAAQPAGDAAFWARFDQIAAGAQRSADNKARDPYRHPKETLEFFGLKPGQKVLEITPGGGWYTELLGPLMKGDGSLTVAIIDPKSASSDRARENTTASNQKYRDKLGATPDLYGEVQFAEFSLAEPKFGADGSYDLVLTFRNVHNWTGAKADAGMFKAFYAALKPGGTLGVEEHRAKAGTTVEDSFKSGYMPQDYVTKLATDAGFKLDGTSEVNANPKDTKDYEGGVWTLPPTLAKKDQDKDKYLAIGESDRMTLRFKKPL
jgi:predicted methyltransferase